MLAPMGDTGVVLDELFRHTPVGVVLSDLHGAILDANDAFCAMLRYERAELIGRPLTELAHPDDVASVRTCAQDLHEGRTGSYVSTARYRAGDGTLVDAKVSASIVHAKERTPLCGIAFFENITDRVAMESALRQSEMRYRRVVEDQSDLIVRLLPDGTHTFVNEAYCRYRGATAEELLRTKVFDYLDDESRPIVREKFARLTPAHPTLTDQRWFAMRNGGRRWVEWTARGFFDDEGRLVEIQGVGRDLTEQQDARELLMESEERYRRLFDNLPVAVWENDWSGVAAELARRNLTSPEALVAAVANDPALYAELGKSVRVTAVNPAALAMAGVATGREFDEWLARAATPEAAVRFSWNVPALVFGDRQFAMDEYTLIRPDGEPIEVLIRIARSPRWEEACTMSTIAVDVTERRRIQRQLEHKQELTERVEAAAHLGTWEWDVTHDLVYGSDEFWRIVDGREGGGPHQRPMTDIRALMHADDDVAVGERWKTLREPSAEPRPTVFENDYRFVRPDGSMVVVRGQNFATYGADGAMTHAFGILRDVTGERRAEEEAARQRDELIRADKMISLGILVSGIAHEINNPNHAIGLNAPLVRNAWREAASLLDEIANARPDLRVARMPWGEARGEVTAMLDDIELASDRIRNIVNELRGYAIDHHDAERQPVSLNAIVQTALRLVGKHIANATRHFATELSPDEPRVVGIPQRLEQVVVNLCLNAAQALENEEQAIRIVTGIEGTRAFIRVQDEGRGIAPEHLPQLRTPFFTTKRRQGGTGLGIPVSDLIATEHGGELTFDSELGRGTTATLWLPLVPR